MTSKETHVGFCENGAGYGGAVISMAAMLEQLPELFSPFIYTGIDTEPYRALSCFGHWSHLPSVTVVDRVALANRGIPFASTIDNVFNLLPHAWRFYRAFKRDRIQLVYLNNDPGCNLAAAIAARRARLPTVVHARGFCDDTRGVRWALSFMDHCIAVSHAVKRQLLHLGVQDDNCTVVPEGLDLTRFHPRQPSQAVRAELGISDNDPVVTLVGGLVDWKGQDILLDACPSILERFSNARVLLVGAAYGRDDAYARQIAQRALRPALRGRVQLLGARNDIPEILSISSVVLHTSTQPEPFGRTFLEGMAMGRPVIASNEGGPPEVIEQEFDGLLIQPRDPRLLADAVSRVLSDAPFARKLGENAARKAATYSIQRHAAQVSSVLRGVISRSSL